MLATVTWEPRKLVKKLKHIWIALISSAYIFLIITHVNKIVEVYSTWDDLKKELLVTFELVNEREKDNTKLLNLKQAKDFQTYAAECKGLRKSLALLQSHEHSGILV